MPLWSAKPAAHMSRWRQKKWARQRIELQLMMREILAVTRKYKPEDRSKVFGVVCIIARGQQQAHKRDQRVVRQTPHAVTQTAPQNRRHSHAALTACTQNTITTAEFASGTAAVIAPSIGRVKNPPAAAALTPPPQPNHVNDDAARWKEAIAPAMLITTRNSSRKDAACHAPAAVESGLRPRSASCCS